MSIDARAAVPRDLRTHLAALAQDLAGRGADGSTALSLAGRQRVAELGERLRRHVTPPDRRWGYRVVAGLFELPAIGPTPEHWSAVLDDESGRALDVALVLVAAALGVPFGWTGQQDGRIVNNVLPSRRDEYRQVGASSTVALAWHTEDAFHPDRADLILLACVRNPGRIGSRVANVRRCELSEEHLEHLTRPLWPIAPDDSYSLGRPPLAADLPGTAPLVRARDGLHLCYDPSYTEPVTTDPAALRAYDRLGAELERCAHAVDLTPGDLLILDNAVVAHGRAPFQASYDGTDRWLKRVQVHTTRRAALVAAGFALSRVEPQP